MSYLGSTSAAVARLRGRSVKRGSGMRGVGASRSTLRGSACGVDPLHARQQTLPPPDEALTGRSRPRSRSFQIVHRVARRFERPIERVFLEGVRETRDAVDLDELSSAIESGAELTTIEAIVLGAGGRLAIQQDVPPTFFARLEDVLARAAVSVGVQSAIVISDAADVEFVFRVADPNVVLFARTRAGELITLISNETRVAIAEVVALGAERGLPPASQARIIRETVGLPSNWALAPVNLTDDIVAGDVSAATGRRLVNPRLKAEIRRRVERGTVTEPWLASVRERYSNNLVRARSRNIARTESLRASNFGLRESWRQGQREGALPREARRFWIVTADDRLRASHAAIPGMNPEGVAIEGGSYRVPGGTSPGPPLGVNCRCSEGLRFPGLRGVL